MYRRDVLLGLMAALGGPAALAACDTGAPEDELLRSIKSDRLGFYSKRDFKLVGVIADAIIPRTDTPGALDAGVPAYLDGMMSVWASDETKKKQRDALKAMRAKLRALGGKDLAKLPDEERRAAVAALDAAAFGEARDSEPVFEQYRALKTLVAQIYYASEPGATQELHYELVPGRWVADAPLAEIGRTWAE